MRHRRNDWGPGTSQSGGPWVLRLLVGSLHLELALDWTLSTEVVVRVSRLKRRVAHKRSRDLTA
jgi:hypothetical protein